MGNFLYVGHLALYLSLRVKIKIMKFWHSDVCWYSLMVKTYEVDKVRLKSDLQTEVDKLRESYI